MICEVCARMVVAAKHTTAQATNLNVKIFKQPSDGAFERSLPVEIVSRRSQNVKHQYLCRICSMRRYGHEIAFQLRDKPSGPAHRPGGDSRQQFVIIRTGLLVNVHVT